MIAFLPGRKLLSLLVILFVLTGCADRSEPRLEAWENGAYQPLVVSAYEITGARDGAATSALATFTMESGERLRVALKIVYNPTPSLGSGRWWFNDATNESGDVTAESIKFLGGQGEGPSLGGRFRLDENGSPRFRVTLPLRPVG